MGKYNSSTTRVKPIFDRIASGPAKGLWLPELLRLPTGGSKLFTPAGFNFTVQEARWGENEKKLDPPVALLSWLIRHPRRPSSGELSSDPVKAQKRRELIEGIESRMIEALALLRNNPRGEDWHIFEGQMCLSRHRVR
jgi:hypothetical protein